MTSQGIAIQHWMAPLPRGPAHDLMTFLQHKGSPWVDDIRRRAWGLVPGAEDHFFTASDGTRTVGNVWYTAARSAPRIGLIGHVLTDPDHRRRGIARQLMERAMSDFHGRGGTVMQLFTSTLYSLPFYEALGFENLYSQQVYHDRDWYMRSPRGSEDILRDWFTCGDVAMRPLAPADLPQYCLLYNAGHDHVLKDRAQQIGCGLEAELAFIEVTQALAQGRGAVCVLENARTIIGAASLIRGTFAHQSHIALFDVHLASPAAIHGPDLARQCLARREPLQVEHVYALAADEAKRGCFTQLGFVSRGVLKDHFRIARQRLDCELFQLVAQ